MLQRLIQRTVSIALAALVTVSLFGLVDHLAQRDGQPAQWAQHTTTRA